MKISRVICFGVVLSLTPLAIAKLSYSNDLLGKTEGLLDVCAKVDSGSASKYQARKKANVKDASEQELAEARATDEYKRAYAFMTSELEKTPKEEVLKACPATVKDEK